MNEKTLDISWLTILKVFIAVIGFYLLFQIQHILVWFIFALIISTLFNPIVDFLNKLKIPRAMAVVLVYLAFFSVIFFSIYLVGVLFIEETQQFIKDFPQYFEKIIFPLLEWFGIEMVGGIEEFIAIFGVSLRGFIVTILEGFAVTIEGVFVSVFIFTIAFFLSLEKGAMERALLVLSPKEYESRVLLFWSRCQNKVSAWFLSRILACLFVAIVSYIAFLLFDVRYPFSLALFAGVLNFIPTIGPLITGIIIFIIVALTSIFQAIFILLVFLLIQIIENNIITPILTQKIVGLSSAIVLVSLVIGATLWGFWGAVLIVPLVAILFEFFNEFLQKRRVDEVEKEKAVIF